MTKDFDADAWLAELGDAPQPRRATERVDASKWEEATDREPEPVILHGYRLGELLGEGAFARVYLGEHVLLDRRAAIKILREVHMDSEVAKRRMAKEASVLATLDHPNVVRLLDFGVTPSGLPFLVTELVEGRTLADTIQGPMDPALIRQIGGEIARGLAAAHALGIVHRDLKPANVMIMPDGRAKILDFGVARMDDGTTRVTKAADLVGTPLYMAPEQIKGAASSTPAVDLYALGVTLFFLATGHPPFQGKRGEVIEAHLVKPPPPLPPLGGLEVLVARLMAKDPASRPGTALEVAEELERRPVPRAISWGRVEAWASLLIALAALLFALAK